MIRKQLLFLILLLTTSMHSHALTCSNLLSFNVNAESLLDKVETLEIQLGKSYSNAYVIYGDEAHKATPFLDDLSLKLNHLTDQILDGIDLLEAGSGLSHIESSIRIFNRAEVKELIVPEVLVSDYDTILNDPKQMIANTIYHTTPANGESLAFLFSPEVLKVLNTRPNSESISDWKNNLYAIQNGVLLGTAYGTGIVRLAKRNPSIANVYEIRARGTGKGRRIYGFQHPRTGVFHFVKIKNLQNHNSSSPEFRALTESVNALHRAEI